MPDFLTPVDIEAAIREAANQISKGVNVRDRCYRDYQEADRVFDVAWAESYLGAKGAVEERKQQAVLATIEPRQRRDDAEAKWKYAESRWRALDAQLRAYQSVGASVRETYRVAGRGED